MIEFDGCSFNLDHLVYVKHGKYNKSEEWYVDVYLTEDHKLTKILQSKEEADELVLGILKQIKELDYGN